MIRLQRHHPIPFQDGFSLLEVLLAGAILSTGLAGLAALLLSSMAGTSESANRVAASMLAEGMADLVLVSPAVENVFLKNPPTTVPDCRAPNSCSTKEFVRSNLKSWQMQAAMQLPGGVGRVCRDSTPQDGSRIVNQCDGTGSTVVKVFWRTAARVGGDPPMVVRIVD